MVLHLSQQPGLGSSSPGFLDKLQAFCAMYKLEEQELTKSFE